MEEQAEARLGQCLFSHPCALLAFLFGSQASGRAMAESDVDIAVWLAEGTLDKDVQLLWDRLEDVVKRPVDLVILNTAAPSLAWAAFRGRPLVVRDRRLFLSLMLRISTEAEDFHEFIEDCWRWRERVRISRSQTCAEGTARQ